MRKAALILCLVAVAGCRSGSRDVEEPTGTPTTLRRFDGSAVTIETLRATRAGAIAAADTIARIEASLREPWAETRDAKALVAESRRAWPDETRLAETAWSNADLPIADAARQPFREIGVYDMARGPFDRRIGAPVPTLEAYAELLLRSHTDQSDNDLLLAAWRRFAAPTSRRGQAFLSGRWVFELDGPGQPRVTIRDSLLGPHSRCGVEMREPASYRGQMQSYEGYSCSAVLIDMLAPGGTSPVLDALNELALAMQQGRAFAAGTLAGGPRGSLRSEDAEFLQAALRGAVSGAGDVAWVPRGAVRVDALFSFLIDSAEARARVALQYREGQWQVTALDYEPAAATATGNSGASIDLMPMLRAWAPASGH